MSTELTQRKNLMKERYSWLEKTFGKKKLMNPIDSDIMSMPVDMQSFHLRRENVNRLWIIKDSIIEIKINGIKQKINIYENMSQQEWEEYTKQFVEDIAFMKSNKMISETLEFWYYDLLNEYHIYMLNINGLFIPYFIKREENVWRVGVIPFTTEELIDLTLLKEFLEGKIYIDKPWFKKWYAPLTQHIYLDTLWVWVYFNYTVNLRYSIFAQGKHSKLFKKKWKFLQDWQYYWYLMWGWITTETMARRFWKTTRVLHDLLTELWSIQTNRYVRLFYASSTTKRLRKFVIDMLELISEWRKAKVYDWNSSEAVLQINRYDDKGKLVPWRPLSRLELFSANEQDAGVGDDPSYIYCDEVERMVWQQARSFLNDIMPIVANERVRLRKISTINTSWLVTPFVKSLWQWEEEEQTRKENGMWIKEFLLSKYYKYFSDIDSEKIVKNNKDEVKKLKDKPREEIRDSLLQRRHCAVRIPWSCNEILSDVEKADTIDLLLDNSYTAYLTERECRLPEETEPLDISSSLVSPNEINKEFDRMLQVVDPRDTGKDKPASVMMTFDQWKIIVFAEDELDWDIIQVAKDTENIFLNRYNENIKMFRRSKDWMPQNKILLFDSRGIWAGLKTHLSNKWIPSVRYMSTTTYRATYNNGQCNVGKMYAYDYMKNMFAFGNILIINNCQKSITSLKHFKPFFNEDTGSISAKWEWWANDDFANAVMMWVWYIAEKMWMKSHLKSWKTIYQLKKELDITKKWNKIEWKEWDSFWEDQNKKPIWFLSSSSLYQKYWR